MPDVRLVGTEKELAAALELRRQVFVVEQGVPPEVERDEHDATAAHAIAVQDGNVVATGRMVFVSPAEARIGRMAVAGPFRRRGIGSRVLSCLEDHARGQGKARILLHAQLPVFGFYVGHGYVSQGGEFLEAGIRHITMVKQL